MARRTAPTIESLLATEHTRLRKAFVPLLLLSASAAGAACASVGADALSSASSLRTTDADDASADGSTVSDAGVIDLDSGPCALPQAPEPSDSDAGDCAEFKRAQCGLPPEYQAIADGCFLPLSQCYEICHRMMRPCHAYGDSCQNNQIVQGRP